MSRADAVNSEYSRRTAPHLYESGKGKKIVGKASSNYQVEDYKRKSAQNFFHPLDAEIDEELSVDDVDETEVTDVLA